MTKLNCPGYLCPTEEHDRGALYKIESDPSKILVVFSDEITIDVLLDDKACVEVVFARRVNIYIYLHPIVREKYPDLYAQAIIVRAHDVDKVRPYLSPH